MENEDIRVIKTKEALMEALVTLLVTKNLDTISVRDLTQTANISRSTFYRNFLDKDDFLEWTMNTLIDGIKEQSSDYNDPSDTPPQFYDRLFDYVYANITFFRAFMNNDDWPQFKKKVIESGIIVYKKILSPYENLICKDISIDFLVNYIVSAHVGAIGHWLATGEESSPQQMAKQLRLLTKDGIFNAVGLHDLTQLPR